MMGWLSKLIVVDNLGCPKCKQNSAEFFWKLKKNYPQIKRICWDLLTLIESYSSDCYKKYKENLDSNNSISFAFSFSIFLSNYIHWLVDWLNGQISFTFGITQKHLFQVTKRRATIVLKPEPARRVDPGLGSIRV
jgi:hypothetical protein